MLKNIKDSLEISYKQGLESDDNIYIKGQIKDWKEMLSNIKHEQELKDNALKMYDEGQQEIERLNNIINEIEKEIINTIEETRNLQDYSKWYVEGYEEAISLTHSSHSGVMLETIKSTTIKRYEYLLNKLQELKGSDK